jgi:hypothetical protein
MTDNHAMRLPLTPFEEPDTITPKIRAMMAAFHQKQSSSTCHLRGSESISPEIAARLPYLTEEETIPSEPIGGGALLYCAQLDPFL